MHSSWNKKIMGKMNASKASGPFSIPTRILATFQGVFIEPLTAIINKSVMEGAFPYIFAQIFKKFAPFVTTSVYLFLPVKGIFSSVCKMKHLETKEFAQKN